MDFMPPYVVKADGSHVKYNRSKVVRTARHFHASRDLAEQVADAVTAKVRNGTSTRQILDWINKELAKHNSQFEKQVNLRRALALIPPAPHFELYIQHLLRNEGYKVESNRILRGLCCEHEVDGIIQKNGERWFVEVKHHYEDHTLTKLDVPRIAYAILDDLQRGHQEGVQPDRFDSVIIITNTKLSHHAKCYSDCYNIHYLCWKTPKGNSLEKLIEKNRYYPITMLGELRPHHKTSLFDNQVFTLHDLIDSDTKELRKKTRISQRILQEYKKYAKTLLSR
jgi:hypothetical protein